MIPLTPAQANNLLHNLETVAPHHGYATLLDFCIGLTADRLSAIRLELVLIFLAAGTETTVALSLDVHPPIAGKVAEVGLDMIAHSSLRLTYYRIGTARLLQAIGKLLHIRDKWARCLLSRPEALTYQDYIHSPQWDVKRQQAVKAAGNRCRKCGATGWLEVHHISYLRMGQERPEDLMALCPTCHAAMDQRSGYGKGRKGVQRG